MQNALLAVGKFKWSIQIINTVLKCLILALPALCQ